MGSGNASYEELVNQLAQARAELRAFKQQQAQPTQTPAPAGINFTQYLIKYETESLILVGQDLRILAVSSPALAFSESFLGKKFSVGDSFFDYFRVTNHEEFQRDFNATLGGKSVTRESRFQGKDGKPHWIEFFLHSLPTENGNSPFAFIRVSDVTDRKLSQSASLQGKNQSQDLALITEFATSFVTISSEEDVYQLIGRQLQLLTGCTIAYVNSYEEDTRRLSIQAMICDEELRKRIVEQTGTDFLGMSSTLDKKIYDELSRGEPVSVAQPAFHRIVLPGYGTQRLIAFGDSLGLGMSCSLGLIRAGKLFGSIVMIFKQGESLRNPEIIKTFAYIASVALQKRQAELAHLGSEYKFQTFVEQAVEGIVLVDENGIITEWNHGEEVITGIEAAEALGRPFWDVQQSMEKRESKSPIYYNQLKLNIQTAVETGKADWLHKLYDVDILTPHGENRTIQVMAFPIQTKKGYILASITRDITSIKRRQRELEVIAEFNKALRPISSRDEILPVISQLLMSLLNLEGLAITSNNIGTDENQVTLAAGEWKMLSGVLLSSGQGITSQVVHTGEKYVNNDLKNHETTHQIQLEIPTVLNCAACIPMTINNQVTGTIWIGKNSPIEEDTLQLVSIISEITANAIQRSSLYEQLTRRLEHISALRLIDRTIASNLDMKIGLHVLLDQVISELRVDAADILLVNQRTQVMEFGDSRGFHSQSIRRSYISIGEGLAGRAALERNVIFIRELNKATDRFTRKELLREENFISYCAAPLVIKGEVKGVLELFHRSRLNPDGNWLEFLENLAGQAAIMMDNFEMYSRLQQSNLELRLAYSRTLEGWVRALDIRDEETEGHTQRVTELTLRLSSFMGVPEDRLVHIQRGALLHDIGKMAVPDSILRKPGVLNPQEWEIMRRHPVIAYELLKPINFLEDALDIPYCHHERWDGTGYPRGLKGEDIPLAARIFSVVDVWDALLFDRPYRSAMVEEEVIKHLQAQASKQFDPRVVQAFLEIINRDKK